MPSIALLSQVAGGLVAVAGVALLVWALLWDRARGRRRCPGRRPRGCWYDMSATAGLRCPECGREAKSEREFSRTRRRWRTAAAGLAIVLIGASVVLRPWLANGQWHRWLPDTVLIGLVSRVDEPWVYEELDRRMGDGVSAEPVHRQDFFWDWQWRMLTRRCATAIESEASGGTRRSALAMILRYCPEPELAVDALVKALGDSDGRLCWLAVWGIKACRYELYDVREKLIPALEAHRNDPDPKNRGDTLTTLQMFADMSQTKLPRRAAFGAPGGPTPDQVVSRLNGAKSDSLVAVHRELGVWPRLLLWPYNDESGPYVVSRFDLDLDGKPGIDCAVRVGDPWGTHCEFLIFVRRGDDWRFLGFIEAGNNGRGAPTARTLSTPGGHAVLIITQFGNGYQDQDIETWFVIRGDRITQSFTRRITIPDRGQPTHPLVNPVHVDYSSTSRLLDGAHGRAIAEFQVQARYAALWHGLWAGTPETEQAKDAGVLFERTGTIRYRMDSSGVLQYDPTSDWPEVEFSGIGYDDQDEFLNHQISRLSQIARTGTDAQKTWLRLFLAMCNDSADREQVRGLLEASSPGGP